MILRLAIFSLGMILGLASFQCSRAESKRDEITMEKDISRIERVRAVHDAEIMAIPGVVSVATGLDDEGRPCLKIGTSTPVENVRPFLPEELQEVNVELEYVGEIRSQ